MLAVSLVAWAGTIFFPSLNLGLLICRVKHWDEIGLLLLLLFFLKYLYIYLAASDLSCGAQAL